MSQVTGRVFLLVNGKTVRSMPGAKYTPGGIERKPVNDDVGFAGAQESITHCQVDFTIPHTAKVSIKQLQAMSGVPITFKTDTGVVFQIDDASCGPKPTLQNGNVTCSFFGTDKDRETLPS